MTTRPRILVLEGPGSASHKLVERWSGDCDFVLVDSLVRALGLLRSEHFDGIFAGAQDPALWRQAASLFQSERILETLADGVALINPDLLTTWVNPAFERWTGSAALGRNFYEALELPEILGPEFCPFHSARAGKTIRTRLLCRGGRFLELQLTPVHDNDGRIGQLIALTRDVTAEVQQQQKLDALHQAGNELAVLSADQLADMSVEERVEHLKNNIRRLTRDLLHYDIVEVRLIDRQTGRLDALLDCGMTPEAAGRHLYAKAEGNGITGYVAATGKSYLCADTAQDPMYLEGCQGGRSSLTVPLVIQDQIIGTFNVESPKPNAFGADDLKFAEIFGREIAASLHTLELLTAQKRTTATQSIEAIGREVAMPVDEILAAATAVLDRYIGHDADLADKLRLILANARAIKQCIQRVGENLAPAPARTGPVDGPAQRLKGLRVLVADNDERVRRSAHGLLGRHGCVVETARDGQEALTMARLGGYDAILTDIRLPDMNGYEVFHRIRQSQPQAQVILMTAYGYDPSHSIVKARQEGLRCVLFKPFRVEQLLEALRNPNGMG